ncbi:MAG: glycosyltransferase [Candidatus Sumerlaea chitinivorans]|nr:glycosyltransferase [Candidatus Sumerlaea chitinivorans]
MRRERMLIITYDYPPALSGVRRMVKFAKFLPEFGIDPIILTTLPLRAFPQDWEAMAEVEAAGYPIYRTPSLDPHYLRGRVAEVPAQLRRWRESLLKILNAPPSPDELRQLEQEGADSATSRKPFVSHKSDAQVGGKPRLTTRCAHLVRRWLYLPDTRFAWLPHAISQAELILEREPVRYVLTTSFPNTTHLIGRWIARRYRVKWVADFRDGWTQNPYFADYPTPLHRRVNRNWERSVVHEASAVLGVSEPIVRHLQRLTPEPEKVHLLPNGFDPDDFENVEPIAFDRFTIAYTGTLFMQRSPESFFAGVRALLDNYRGIEENFQVIFMTQFRPEHEECIWAMGLERVVQNWGLQSYRKALQLQKSADALLVLEGEGKNAEIMITQKVFEYLATGKPILAISPPNALTSLLQETGAGVSVHPDDIRKIKDRLYELFTGTLTLRRNKEKIQRFHRKELTRRLVEIIQDR